MSGSEPPDKTPFAAPLSPGSSFGDRFHIERVVGGGGMGFVYEAMDLYKRELVALKILRYRRELLDDAGERFRREAEILASLDHPNIVEIHDFGYASDGTPWLTMELLEGQTLRSRLEGEGALELEELRSLLEQAASALEQAHAQGIIHRDLKPEHVFLVADGSIKLLDFGLSLSVSSKRLTKKGAVVGTPRYMAPEQILSASDAGAQADVYGLGVLTYEALANQSPFDVVDHGQLLGAIAQGRVVPLQDRRRDLPASVFNVVHTAIAPVARDRYGSPAEFAEAFGAALDRPTSTPKSALRNPVSSTLIVLFVAVVVGVVWAMLRIR